MLNRYPLWKNMMVIIVVAIGIFYSLPNFYGEDPAVQISGTRGVQADTTVLANVQQLLIKNHLDAKSISLNNGNILIRFKNTDTQLLAKDDIAQALGDNYSVALNLAPATPKWLANIGATPMKWGLDLRGGVRFLMQVDMNTVLKKHQQQLEDDLRVDLRKAHFQYRSIIPATDFSINIILTNPENLSDVKVLLHKKYPNIDIKEINNNQLTLTLSEKAFIEERNLAIEQNLNILRRRVEELGVAEPVIQRQGADRIVVELPGIQDTARAKEILGATATLEFHLVNHNANLEAAINGMVPADSEIKYDKNGRPVVLYRRAILGGEHITNANSGTDQNGRPDVNVTLDSKGGEIMAQATKLNLGKPMGTLYVEYKNSGKKDSFGKPILEKYEQVINVATIQSRFSNQFQITGIDSPAEAQNLAVLLRSGALTAPIQIVEERTVGPSLGAQNVAQGLKAGLWGLGITILFMLVYYRLFGLISDIALIANMVLLVGLMSLLPGATLTMPGIAGIVLSVGMSVDANVLIFERIKEEIRNGRSVQQAINEGYSGAFSSIFDANLTTILTCIVLYAIGTGPVKGFAVTLSLGVAISMFTAITGTRMLVNWIYGGKRVKKLSI